MPLTKWRDKGSGAMMEAEMLTHTVESGSESIAVNERQPDGWKAESYVCPFKKGQKVLLWIESMMTQKGLTSSRGQIQPIKE